MELSGSYFVYDGTSSRQYGLLFANADTSRVTSLIGEIDSVTVYSKNGRRNYFVGESFENSPLVFDIEVITDDDRGIDQFARREIEKWLFRQNDYKKLYLDMPCDPMGETYEIIDGDQKQLYLNCRFTNPSKIESVGGIVGYKFTVECDNRMAWQDPVVYEHTLSSTGGTFSTTIPVDVDTDVGDYVYPSISITMGASGGDIRIVNVTDDATRLTTFSGLSPNITFTMKGDGINYISGGNYMKFVNRNFVRLLDGENTLSLYGDIVRIRIEFQNQRYI